MRSKECASAEMKKRRPTATQRQQRNHMQKAIMRNDTKGHHSNAHSFAQSNELQCTCKCFPPLASQKSLDAIASKVKVSANGNWSEFQFCKCLHAVRCRIRTHVFPEMCCQRFLSSLGLAQQLLRWWRLAITSTFVRCSDCTLSDGTKF